jgi:DNA-binding FadR family transcriptional regulator
MSLDRLERPPLVSRSVQDAIRNYVITERLRPGDALPPETELARQLGVGRNSVREAVKALQSLGILEVRRGSGLYVRDFSLEPLLDSLPYAMMSDVQDLADVFEVRRVLEIGVIGTAMQSMPPDAIDRLQTVLRQMRTLAEQGRPFAAEDREFHRLIFQHVGNKILLTLLDAFWLVYRKAAEHAVIRDPNPMGTFGDHAAIVAAIEKGDVVAARRALTVHYDGLLSRLQTLQEERERESGSHRRSSE